MPSSVPDHVFRNDFDIDDMGFRVTYFCHKRNPYQQFELETRFGERKLIKRNLQTGTVTDMTTMLTGAHGRSHEGYSREVDLMIVRQGRGRVDVEQVA